MSFKSAVGAAAQTSRISGRVTNQQGQGINAATITLQGFQIGVQNTDSGGYYTFFNVAGGGNYTLTPSKNNYSFTPAARTIFNLNSNQTNVDFTGIKNTYSISGYITDTQGQPAPQATVAVSGSQTGSTTTDNKGFYTLAGLAAEGNYTVTPSKTGYVFTPTNRTYTNLLSNEINANFTATSTNYFISGFVRDAQGQPISQATINLTGSQTGAATTNGSGYYVFPGLPSGGNFTLTASKSGYSFTPIDRIYNNLTANQTGADFTGTSGFTMTINYGYNAVGALGGVGTNLIEGDQWGNVASGLSYRGTGAIKSMNYGNGRRLRMSYDANRQQPVGMVVDRQDGSCQ